MNTKSTLLFVAALLATAASAQENGSAPDTRLARGRYIVEKVGLCADCHSPRNERGEFVMARWLQGAPLAFAPTVPMPAWAAAAPAIAGLPSMSEAQAAEFLQHGTRPDGSQPRPPMPEFRLSADDAAAVAAYLKSLAR